MWYQKVLWYQDPAYIKKILESDPNPSRKIIGFVTHVTGYVSGIRYRDNPVTHRKIDEVGDLCTRFDEKSLWRRENGHVWCHYAQPELAASWRHVVEEIEEIQLRSSDHMVYTYEEGWLQSYIHKDGNSGVHLKPTLLIVQWRVD